MIQRAGAPKLIFKERQKFQGRGEKFVDLVNFRVDITDFTKIFRWVRQVVLTTHSSRDEVARCNLRNTPTESEQNRGKLSS